MTTGERLTELRNKLGLSQEQMADKLGVKRSTYAKWEKDINKPTRKVNDIAAYFHVTTDYILGRTAQPAQPPAAPPSTPALTPQEQELLRKYRVLTPNSRAAVDAVLDTCYNNDRPKIEDTAT